MADWQDLGDGYVRAPDGREVPRELLPPTERILPPAAPAPPAAAPIAPPPSIAAPAAQAAPGAPVGNTAQSVLAKLDEPSIAAARGQSQLPVAQQTTTTQSAIPMSTLKPVMDRGTQRADAQADAVRQAGESRAQIGEQQAMTAATAAYGQQQTSQAEAEQAAQRAEIARQNQIAIAAQEDPSIDPDRFIRGMSTGQSIGTIILAAVEGAFRGMTGQAGQSGVLNILERRIDQDIMSQKEQIASGRIRRGNMISYFQQQGMTEEAAEKAAKAMAYAQGEKLVQAEIARLGAGGARAEANAMAEQIKAAREQANDELMLTLGTPRSSTTTVRQAPGGGDGDGFSKLLSARKAYEESGATPEQLAAFDKANGMGAMAPGGESETSRTRREAGEKRSEDQGKAAAAYATITQLGDAVGLTKDPSTNKYRAPDGLGVGWKLGKMTELKAAQAAAVEGLGRLQSGGVISPSEAANFQSILGNAEATQEEIAINLNSLRTLVEPRMQAGDRKAAGETAAAAGFRKVE